LPISTRRIDFLEQPESELGRVEGKIALHRQLDPCMMAGSGGAAPVAREQRRVERCRKGDKEASP
jgi:hypothetical protein